MTTLSPDLAQWDRMAWQLRDAPSTESALKLLAEWLEKDQTINKVALFAALLSLDAQQRGTAEGVALTVSAALNYLAYEESGMTGLSVLQAYGILGRKP
ncbi:MAG TPA: hypothetical protein VFG51_00350 [Candidatus Saccharimonadia bacterium]|nr:hypothetical protein [Candidatus Saccharimonadia bacterium]